MRLKLWKAVEAVESDGDGVRRHDSGIFRKRPTDGGVSR